MHGEFVYVWVKVEDFEIHENTIFRDKRINIDENKLAFYSPLIWNVRRFNNAYLRYLYVFRKLELIVFLNLVNQKCNPITY